MIADPRIAAAAPIAAPAADLEALARELDVSEIDLRLALYDRAVASARRSGGDAASHLLAWLARWRAAGRPRPRPGRFGWAG